MITFKEIVILSLLLLALPSAYAEDRFQIPLDGEQFQAGPITIRVSKSGPSEMVLVRAVDPCSQSTILEVPGGQTETRMTLSQPGPHTLFALSSVVPPSGVGDIRRILIALPQTPPSSMIVYPRRISFIRPGETRLLDISLTYDTGKVRLCAIEGLPLYITSSNAAVVSVASSGELVAEGQGTAEVYVAVGPLTVTVPIFVGLPIKGDLDGDGDIDSDDVSWLTASIPVAMATTNDTRDLNKDGKVDALDARVLTTLCTRSRCATR